ncbi:MULTISPECIES: hypothetical protein [unclassified Streptomyces]|uniref:hypothetical protein n=1 Tax=unclassified Streptomyces TaxID=2593676 RepID=UPI002E7887B6|nr:MULTISPECIES: hypothetical protein [unclassified Streptomyces]MEE1760227.1 hypothetical protein [Streptomyces sp. SP18BB07]MEE1836320.1 hypothetical protein [Streptomyces sp. SP17KL33]
MRVREAAIRKRTAKAVCGFALCGALATPAVIEAASVVAESGQTQVDAEQNGEEAEEAEEGALAPVPLVTVPPGLPPARDRPELVTPSVRTSTPFGAGPHQTRVPGGDRVDAWVGAEMPPARDTSALRWDN